MNALLSFQHRASHNAPKFIGLCAIFFFFSAAPTYGQLSGAYQGGGMYFVFANDGTLVTCDLNGNNATSGSYEIDNGLMYFYDQRGKFTGSYYYRKTSGAITLSTDTDALRLKYHCDVDEFVGAVLVGSALQYIFDN